MFGIEAGSSCGNTDCDVTTEATRANSPTTFPFLRSQGTASNNRQPHALASVYGRVALTSGHTSGNVGTRKTGSTTKPVVGRPRHSRSAPSKMGLRKNSFSPKTVNRRLPQDYRLSRVKCGLCIFALLVAVACIVFLTVYLLTQEGVPKRTSEALPILQDKWRASCPSTRNSSRYDCYPEVGATEGRCVARGCCWMTPTKNAINEPACVYPENYGYIVAGQEKQFLDGWELPLVRMRMPSRYGDDAQKVMVRVEMQTSTRLRIKIYSPTLDDQGDLQEPKIPVEKPDISRYSRRTNLYAVSYRTTSVPFSLRVRRVDTGTIIFDTSVGGFTFSNQFSQITTKLPSSTIYGLGPLLSPSPNQSTTWHTWSLFTGNSFESDFIKSHGGHPMHMCLENDGKAHAVLLRSSYPMDYQLQPTPALTYRVLGGPLDFYIFLGPTPEEVIQQYTEAVGRPFLPPYWTLGFQISHMGADTIQAVRDSLRDVNKNNISYDVISMGDEYKNNGLDFTVDHKRFSNLLLFVEEMASQNRHIDLNVDPALSVETPATTYPAYDEGQKIGLFINNSLGKASLVGRTSSGKSVFIDFGHKDATRWWTRQLERLRSIARFHTLSLTDNYPTNWVNGSMGGCLADNFNNPPYMLKAFEKTKLYWNTICLDSLQFQSMKKLRHYGLHNSYGHEMIKTTYRALSNLFPSGRRVAMISQSTFVGSGKYSGFWATNNTRSWLHMQQSIELMLSYNLYGVPLVGSAICGTDVYREDDELCIRWIQLGAFYPLARMLHDPIFCNKNFGRIAKIAIDTRYQLLPYLYTLFYEAATIGSTVARPLFHEFYADKIIRDITNQFMWGSALMVVPVLQQSLRVIDAYLPQGHWYIYYTGGHLLSSGERVTMEAPLDRIGLLIRGGHIIPTQPPGATTYHSRQNYMHLIVALDGSMKAKGFLYWDDGMIRDTHLNKEHVIVNFTAGENTLKVSGRKMQPLLSPTVTSVYFNSVDIMGLPYKPLIATISGTAGVLGTDQMIWDGRGKVLKLRELIIPLTETVEIKWRWAK